MLAITLGTAFRSLASQIYHLIAVGEVCQYMGIREDTFYNWKKKYGVLGTLEMHWLRELEEKTASLNNWWPIYPLTSTCFGRSSIRSFKAGNTQTAGPIAHWWVLGVCAQSNVLGFAGSFHVLLQGQPIGWYVPYSANQRDRTYLCTLWILKDLYIVVTGGLAG